MLNKKILTIGIIAVVVLAVVYLANKAITNPITIAPQPSPPHDNTKQEQASSSCPKTAINYPKEAEYFSSFYPSSMPLILSTGDSASYAFNLYKREVGTLILSNVVPRCQDRISSEELILKNSGNYTLVIFGSEGSDQTCVSENNLEKFLKNRACTKDSAVINFKETTK